MGDTTTKKQKGVLKLVHPGRHVEIHKQPITAAEVIKKNPRHSITRPEVFKFPWLVVSARIHFASWGERRYKHNVTSFMQDALIGGSGTWEELNSEREVSTSSSDRLLPARQGSNQ
ncbi:hypothetical protein QQ045_005807 [Rhodiola kirilowii]